MFFCRENDIKIIYLITIRATTCTGKAGYHNRTSADILSNPGKCTIILYGYKNVNINIVADVFRVHIPTSHTYWVFMMHIPIYCAHVPIYYCSFTINGSDVEHSRNICLNIAYDPVDPKYLYPAIFKS